MNDMNTVTISDLKPLTKVDGALDQFITHHEIMKYLSMLQIERDKQDRQLMNMGICPECKGEDTDEIYVPGEFPNFGYFAFRCNRIGCGFKTE